jgi:hypothetical protein
MLGGTMKTQWIRYTAGGRSGYMEGWLILPPASPLDDVALQVIVRELVRARVGSEFDSISWTLSDAPPSQVMKDHLNQMRRDFTNLGLMITDLKEDYAALAQE